MTRMDVNRAAEMEVFARVVDLGGFTAAAQACGLTPSGVSKLITRLEARLGTRLLHRSTRRLSLTPEGQAFYARAVRILGEMEEAEREASAGAAPRGHLRVNSNVPFGMRYLIPLVPEFLANHPGITLDLVLSDAVVDLMEERADVAIRTGPLHDSSLMIRKLGSTRMVVVASPAYLEQHGTPRHPGDLARHKGIGWTFPRTIGGWPFRTDNGMKEHMPPIIARASDGEAARLFALRGVGLARLALFQVETDIAADALMPVLEDMNPGDGEDIHAVYLGGISPLPARVRAFVDYMAARCRNPNA
ncbi:LysR family transcriptional regulator [Azospirillum ramasamyi]|uniref:LysR family transcriptional regulator n=1 Tax=Azospirillum ramasamyi TaxID=682998 RepID=A0A2U9S7Q9_9PROT|nr:LysR family transcriptional regulator [Azospirillum ramasamyi]AWU95580.1 LysR family transcriptional regulator [Azospirillum ramasamyi]